MGKKLLCLIMALCCVFGLVACGEDKIAADKAGTDSTLSGGFVAETNDYVYFINGIESYETEYKDGNVTKGALLRTKKSNLANLANATYETVVSKLLVAGDTDAGFYIFGDYVYYAVSSTENDKTGTTKKDKLNFFRTKLDATDTSKNIVDRDFTNSVTYRYIKSGDGVYLVIHSTDLFVYDAVNGGLLFTTEVNAEDKKYKKDEEKLNADKLSKIDVSEVVFAGNNVYVTSNPINQHLSNPDNIQKDAYHVVYKIDFAGKKLEKIIDGAGTTVIDGDDNYNASGIGVLGVTIDLLRVADGKLYFSYTSLNTIEGSQPVYMCIPEKDLTNIATTWHTKAEYVYTETTSNTASIFADSSIFYNGKVYYVQADIGLLVYDNTQKDEPTTDNGVVVFHSSEIMKGATLDFVNVESGVPFLYFHDASNNYYKFNLNTKEDEFRINKHAINSAWYKPEVVKSGDKYYFIAVYSGADFKSYSYVIDMAKMKADYDAWEADETEDTEGDFYAVEIDSDEKFDVFAKANGLLGVAAEKDVNEESTGESESK